LFVANSALGGQGSGWTGFNGGRGGAISIDSGSATITQCVFRLNRATTYGGAVHVYRSNTVAIARSTFANNIADGITNYTGPHTVGGAFAVSGGNCFVSESSFTSNTVVSRSYSGIGGAGGILLGTAQIVDCDFWHNNSFSARGFDAQGGALAIIDRGRASVSRTIFRGNGAFGNNGSAYGGAIFGGNDYANGGTNVDITNCTFVGNQVRASASYASGGGAIATPFTLVNLWFSTVASNTASDVKGTNSSGGGLYAKTGFYNLRGTILAGNAVNTNFNTNATGSITDEGYNISSDGRSWNQNTSTNNTDPLLLPLANNGGPTLTMGLKVGSPALNNADCASAPATDQRGYPRPSGPGCDVGAWEGAGGQVRLAILREGVATNAIAWLTDAGTSYRVEGATALNAWSVLASNLLGTGGTLQFRATNAGIRFIRVGVEP
jgi:hypothetical protein